MRAKIRQGVQNVQHVQGDAQRAAQSERGVCKRLLPLNQEVMRFLHTAHSIFYHTGEKENDNDIYKNTHYDYVTLRVARRGNATVRVQLCRAAPAAIGGQ